MGHSCNGSCSCSMETRPNLNEKVINIVERIDKKLIFELLLSIIIFIISMFINNNIIKISLFVISYFIVAYQVIFRAIKNIVKGKFLDENFLMMIATFGAFAIKEYHEAIGVMIFYKIGEIVEKMAVNYSKKSLKKILDIKPDYANLQVGNEITKVDPTEVKENDIIFVKPGEKVPLDGIIIKGNSSVDSSSLTGESLPKSVSKDDTVLSGFINKTGLLEIKVTNSFFESTVSKILNLVENASHKKAKTEKFITKFSKYYTPFVVICAILLAILVPLITKQSFSIWFHRALVFLVISCPCSLVLSIPLGYFAGIGVAAKNGILIKGTNYLESLNNVNTIVFDKTGTLTKGIFKIDVINPSSKFTKDILLELAAYGEYYSTHPIANSIIKSYGKDIDKSKINNYQELAGFGVSVKIDNKNILIGNYKLMEKEKIEYFKSELNDSIVHIAIDGYYAGNIGLVDEIKEDSEEAIKQLYKMGIKNILMLTGDNNSPARKVAKQLNIKTFYSNLLPHEKLEKLEALLSDNKKEQLIFVGDGINDAPVLARSDIGISVGGLGSDAAIEASDIVLMNDEPSKIITALQIAKKTRSVVYQNIFFILLVKIIIMAFGTAGIANLWMAVFADVGLALIAILSSLRVLRFNK